MSTTEGAVPRIHLRVANKKAYVWDVEGNNVPSPLSKTDAFPVQTLQPFAQNIGFVVFLQALYHI